MRRSQLLAVLCLSATAFVNAVAAQTPSKALPNNYKVELENAYVKVTRASFAPHEKVPVHLHPTYPTVYVYLTDGGPMRFIHITPSYTIESPSVRVGGIRYNRNWHDETHVIEYLGDVPTEYLRVEMKTTPGNPHRDVRIAPEDNAVFEDAQVRISRHLCLCELPPGPSLVVKPGDRSFTWVAPGDGPAPTAGSGQVAQIWIELKTQPIK